MNGERSYFNDVFTREQIEQFVLNERGGALFYFVNKSIRRKASTIELEFLPIHVQGQELNSYSIHSYFDDGSHRKDGPFTKSFSMVNEIEGTPRYIVLDDETLDIFQIAYQFNHL